MKVEKYLPTNRKKCQKEEYELKANKFRFAYLIIHKYFNDPNGNERETNKLNRRRNMFKLRPASAISIRSMIRLNLELHQRKEYSKQCN